jgi:predicted double-glycine peptidase
MNPWFESLAVGLLAVAGFLLGRWFSRLPKPYWMLGYFIPLSLILLYGLATRNPTFAFVPPISWMMMGRNKFAVIGFIGTMVLTTPLSRLPRRRDRIFVMVLMIAIVWQMSVWPFLAPAFNRNYLAHLTTQVDGDGVCRQSNDYNCGPAAAVTALRKLGLPAEEGEIAILAHTSSATGTPPDILARELNEHYGKDGLVAEYRNFKNVAGLPTAGLSLAIIKFSFMIDHYVTVLEVTPTEVVVADPLSGRTTYTHEEFEDKWRHVAVVLRRTLDSRSIR